MALRTCRLCGDMKPLKDFPKRTKQSHRTECNDCYKKIRSERTKNRIAVTANTILVIPDQHAPYHHPDTIPFLRTVRDLYKPTRVINLGDEVDNHAISFHDSDPDLDGAGAELNRAREFIGQLAALFPVMDLMDSNHGSLLYRRGKANGIPRHMLRDYHDVLGAPKGWAWHHELVVDGILFHHGDGKPGKIHNTMARELMSVVQGHHHSEFGIAYHQTFRGTIFGVSAGCLIDDKSLAFAYNKKTTKRPVIGCCVIVNGHPMLIRMKMDADGRWTGDI